MQSLQQYDNLQDSLRRKLQQKWISYYSVDGISKQKSFNMRYTPNTPVEGAIFSLTQQIQQLSDTLTNTQEGVKIPKIQRGYNELEKLYEKLQKSGLLDKDTTLDKLLKRFPALYSFIRKNIHSQTSNDVLNNPDIEDDVKKEITKSIPSIEQAVIQQLLLEDKKNSNNNSNAQTVVSVPSSMEMFNARFRNVEYDVKQFLNMTGYSRLPPTLANQLENIINDMKILRNQPNIDRMDVAELDHELESFRQSLREAEDEVVEARKSNQSFGRQNYINDDDEEYLQQLQQKRNEQKNKEQLIVKKANSIPEEKYKAAKEFTDVLQEDNFFKELYESSSPKQQQKMQDKFVEQMTKETKSKNKNKNKNKNKQQPVGTPQRGKKTQAVSSNMSASGKNKKASKKASKKVSKPKKKVASKKKKVSKKRVAFSAGSTESKVAFLPEGISNF